MDTDLILSDTREALGLEPLGTEFNKEILTHINAAISILVQNGVGTEGIVVDAETTWADFKNSEQINGNKVFNLVPAFIYTKTKILFDPPPPSNVPFYDAYIKETEWRLKAAYELDNPITTTTTTTIHDPWM